MAQGFKYQQRKPVPADPLASETAEKVIEQKYKAEEHEIAGRHDQDGQKDHKGAR